MDALDSASFSVQPQEFVCVLGPSGSGKTTLAAHSGWFAPTYFRDVYFCQLASRSIGMVFQQANLMPWRTTLENIILPLELQGVPADEACARAQDLIDLVGLQGFEFVLAA